MSPNDHARHDAPPKIGRHDAHQVINLIKAEIVSKAELIDEVKGDIENSRTSLKRRMMNKKLTRQMREFDGLVDRFNYLVSKFGQPKNPEKGTPVEEGEEE